MGLPFEDCGRGEGSYSGEAERHYDSRVGVRRCERGLGPGGSDNDSEGNTTGPRYQGSQGPRGNHCQDHAVTVEGVHRPRILPDSPTTISNVLENVSHARHRRSCCATQTALMKSLYPLVMSMYARSTSLISGMSSLSSSGRSVSFWGRWKKPLNLPSRAASLSVQSSFARMRSNSALRSTSSVTSGSRPNMSSASL